MYVFMYVTYIKRLVFAESASFVNVVLAYVFIVLDHDLPQRRFSQLPFPRHRYEMFCKATLFVGIRYMSQPRV